MEAAEKFQVRPITPEELESSITELDEHLENVFNLEEAKQEFDALVKTLEEKRTKMRETIQTLEKTKDVLKTELSRRANEEKKLNQVIAELSEEKISLEQSIRDSQEQLEKTSTEKEKISVLMGSLKAAIEDMRKKLAEL